MKTKIKLSLQDLSIFVNMLEGSLKYYKQRVLQSDSNATILAEEILPYCVFDKLHEKVSIKLHQADRVKRPYTTINLSEVESYMLLKAHLPTFNNSYYSTIKFEIIDVIVKGIYLKQSLLFNL